MHTLFTFLLRYGYVLLFAWVFAEQLGLPIPSIPLLLAAGALAGAAKMSLSTAVALAVCASLLSDTIWYEIGRRRGGQVLNFLCRISLEPDSCVRRTEEIYAKHGARALLVAKFVPGFSTAAPPLAGMFHVKFLRFVMFDAVGALLWAGGFAGLGFAFSSQIEGVAASAGVLGNWLVAALLGGLVLYIAWKYVKRRMFLRQLRIARISPAELKRKMDAGERLVVVDLRQSLDFEADPSTIPGAVLLSPDELEENHAQIPRDRDVILYCT